MHQRENQSANNYRYAHTAKLLKELKEKNPRDQFFCYWSYDTYAKDENDLLLNDPLRKKLLYQVMERMLRRGQMENLLNEEIPTK